MRAQMGHTEVISAQSSIPYSAVPGLPAFPGFRRQSGGPSHCPAVCCCNIAIALIDVATPGF